MQECRSYFSPCLAGKLSRKRCCLRDLSFTSFQNYSMKSVIFLAQRKERKTPTLMARSPLGRWGVSSIPAQLMLWGICISSWTGPGLKATGYSGGLGFLLPLWVSCGLQVVQPPTQEGGGGYIELFKLL